MQVTVKNAVLKEKITQTSNLKIWPHLSHKTAQDRNDFSKQVDYNEKMHVREYLSFK